MVFALHQRLAADTTPVGSLALCRILLMNNALWPWVILVPACPGVTEVHQLAAGDRALLIEDVARTGAAVERLFTPHKINVAAIGNIVPQLHIHVVARRRDDPAWPNPVWGSGLGRPYEPGEADSVAVRLAAALAAD